MPIQRFFQGASELTDTPYFLNVYHTRIQPYMNTSKPTLFREAVQIRDDLIEPERTDLLFKIFVEPFAVLEYSNPLGEKGGNTT